MADSPASTAADPWRLLAVAFVIQMGFSCLDQGVPLLTGFVKADLGTSASLAGLAISSFLFGKVFGAYAGGSAADRFGEREVLVAAGLIAAGVIFIAVWQPPVVLFALLFVAGVSSAAATPAGGRLIMTSFRPARRGLALGIRQTGIPTAGVLVAIALPAIAREYGWRWALVFAASMMALSVIPLWFTKVRRSERGPRQRGGFLKMARNRELVLLTIWSCLFVTGQFALLAFLVLDMHETRGIDLTVASLAVAVSQLGGIVGRVGWGWGSDRMLSLGRRPLLLACTALGVAASLLLFVIPVSAPAWVVIAAAALAGLALIGYQGLWVTMVTEAAPPEYVGAATGFAVTFVILAGAAAPPLYGLAADAFSTYQAVWGALTVVLAAAFVPALLLHERREV